MNRPCFSLGVLLSSLAVCLFAVGSANSQTGLDLHTPPCLMCPYAGPPFAHQTFSVAAEPTDDPAAVIALPTETTPNDGLSCEPNVEVDGTDCDLDYKADYDYSEYDDTDVTEADYDYSEYDDSDYKGTYDYGYEGDHTDADTEANADLNSGDSEYDYSDYDYSEYESGYDYEGDYTHADTEADADLNVDDSDDSEYDYSEYDYSEYESGYDYGYDYEGDYTDADTEANADLNANDSDDSEYHYSDYDYSEYESGYEYESDDSEYDDADYGDFYEEENTDAPVPAVVVPSNESTPAVTGEHDKFDNYDYEDYFAEVDGTDEEVIEAGSAEAPEDEASVISNEDVEAFDYFDEDVYGPAATEQDPSIGDDGFYENFKGYESEDDHTEMIEMIEEAQADDITTPMIDAVELEAEVSADADVSQGVNESADSLYDLRTTYDPAYDEVMAPATETPSAQHHDLGSTDHCFGGYFDPYRSEYRCDLADQYQVEPYQSIVTVPPALSLMVESYIALVMERAGQAYQQFSLEAIASKAANQVVKLPRALSASEPEGSQKTSLADNIDCHVDAAGCETDWREIDCFAPWEPTRPVGSGVKSSDNSSLELTDQEAEAVDTTALDAAKASIRDLNSRLNAARRSPPLR
ncbi:MAG TPA: hypothetical protein QF564_00325 [Pirellulaceae bacterium]|nr:hypothetical protein [Pirellulaceae bacterium]